MVLPRVEFKPRHELLSFHQHHQTTEWPGVKDLKAHPVPPLQFHLPTRAPSKGISISRSASAVLCLVLPPPSVLVDVCSCPTLGFGVADFKAESGARSPLCCLLMFYHLWGILVVPFCQPLP